MSGAVTLGFKGSASNQSRSRSADSLVNTSAMWTLAPAVKYGQSSQTAASPPDY